MNARFVRLNTPAEALLSDIRDAADAVVAAAPALPTGQEVQAASAAVARRAWGGFGWSGVWLVLPVLLLLLAGNMLRESTTAFYTNSATVTSNSFTTSVVSLTPSVTTLSVSNLVPGDFRSTTGQITNASSIGVNYFLTIWADTSSALDTNTSTGLQLVVFRCGTLTAPATCSSATTFETVTGVMDQASTLRVTTTGGPPSSAGTSVSGTSLVFTSGSGNLTASGGNTVAGVPILTKNVANGQGRCSVSNDGACPLGGYSGISVSSPSVAVTSGSHNMTLPAVTSGNGLGASGGGSDVDNLLVYAFLPSSAGTGFQGLNSSISLAFTAVQPNGQTTATNGAVHS